MIETVLLASSAGLVLVLTSFWAREAWAHTRRLRALEWRIHVNGIRGKSTVTRLLAGILREAGIVTIGKTTGSATAVIDPEGTDIPLRRRGAATILEQIDVVDRYVPKGTQALVVECMALKPDYQRMDMARLVQPNVSVITNVREDHQDVMGETLPEIARSLLNTTPRNGVLITAEQNPALLRIIAEEVGRRGSTLLVADPDQVSDEEIEQFSYVAFKSNVAIGLAVANLLGIPRAVAMQGMVRAAPDPGVLRFRHLTLGDKQVTWANLFAVNDRESAIAVFELVLQQCTPDTTVVGILNNRADRERRALQFADVAARDLVFDRLVTFGAHETAVTERLIRNGFPREHIRNLGERRNPSMEEILDAVIRSAPTSHVVLVGLVNIHTKQAEMLLEFLEGSGAAPAAAPPRRGPHAGRAPPSARESAAGVGGGVAV